MWQGIYGHDDIVDRFRRTLAAGRLASTYLFVGPEGVGKRALSVKLAKALLCMQGDAASLDPCDECESCVLADAGTHPDLHLVEPIAGKRNLRIEQFVGDQEHRHREGMCHEISLRPMVGRRRVAIIDGADWLTLESANSLLKLLEEPPPGTVIILIGTSRSRQLPTIQSRAQLVRFEPLPASEMRELVLARGLATVEADAAALALRSGGSLARARELADPLLGEVCDRIVGAWRSNQLDVLRLMQESDAFILAAGKESEHRRARFRQILVQVGDALRKTLRDQCATGVDVERTLAALDRCLEAEDQLDRNANQATLLQSWLDDLTSLAERDFDHTRA